MRKMNRTSAAVVMEPIVKHRAFIWLHGAEVPAARCIECKARSHGNTKDIWDIDISWDYLVKYDEIKAEVYWTGPDLKSGDIVRLLQNDVEIGILRVLEPKE
jgi:hypothetical protein